MTFGLVGMTGLLAASFTQIVMGMALGFVCLLLMMIILIQKGRGGGLTSAFGGGGGGGGAFGAKTGDVFTGITVVLAFVFLLLTVFGNYVMRPEGVNTGKNTVQGARTVPASGAVAPDAANTGDKPAAVLIPDAVKKDSDKNDAEVTDPAQPNAGPDSGGTDGGGTDGEGTETGGGTETPVESDDADDAGDELSKEPMPDDSKDEGGSGEAP